MMRTERSAVTQEDDKRRGPISFRIRPEALAKIDARAQAAGLSRNAYMIRASLGELDDPSAVEERLNDLEARLERVERLQELGA